MLKQVSNPTVLPNPSFSTDVTANARFIQALVMSLATEMTNHARRINLLLPFGGSEAMTAPLPLLHSTVVEVPAAALWEGGMIYVSNEAGGKTIAFSDGTNWRRVQDRAIIS